ncbi:MAG: TonB-dependent receptor [Bacteroidota bacterium]
MKVQPLIVWLSALCFFSSSLYSQNITLSGSLTDPSNEAPLPGIEVQLVGGLQTTISDASGYFELYEVPSGAQTLNFYNKEVLLQSMDVEVGSSSPQDLGTIEVGVAVTTSLAEDIPTISLSNEDLETGEGNLQYSNLLTASRDAFVSSARFVFGPRRFRIRGYDSENNQVYINGMPVNELENGRVSFSHWSGLNDITRNSDLSIGLDPLDYSFGGVGGASTIDMRASRQRKQLRLNYSATNGNYRNRLMATWSTGLLKNNWAFSFSGSRRWADEGYVAGTFYDAWAYYMSAEKRIGKHALNLTVFGTPIRRGKATAVVQELYDLSGDNYYNPFWGYQNGRKRNSRVGDTHQPMYILTHDWNISPKTAITTTIGYQNGRNGGTALDWYDANDPRPNYYRKLPSYIEAVSGSEIADQVAERLRTDENSRQMAWDDFYEVNRNSLTTIENANGSGMPFTGNRSRYVIEDRRYDSERLNVYTNLRHQLNDQLMFQGGISYQMQKVHTFKEIVDLLGGDFYVDLDRFAERDFPDNPEAVFNDIRTPNRILRVGDRFGYDYDANINKGALWGQLQYDLGNLDVFLSGEASRTTFWRTGFMQNGRFPDDSLGDSEKQNFTNGGVKMGLSYAIDGRNYVQLRAAYMTRAPFFRNSYLSPRTRNQAVAGLTNEKILSGEAAYILRTPIIKAKASFYYTQFRDQIFTRSFFQDDLQTDDTGLRDGFVNFIMTGIDKQHLGTELSAEVNLTPALTLKAVAAIGQYIFNSRPSASIVQDNNADFLVENRTVYAKNFYVPGRPQRAYNLGLSYRGKNFWNVYLDFSYYSDLYIDFNPNRRTEAAITDIDGFDKLEQGTQLWNNILAQEKRNGFFMIDLSVSKSLKVGNRRYIYLNARINNLLNNQDYVTGGYEQLRFDFETKDVNRFANRYFYGYGLGYFVGITYRM